MIEIARLMQRDENVLLRYKIRRQRSEMVTPEFSKIITQGVEEGVFDTAFVEDAARMVLAIMDTFSESLTDLLLHPSNYDNPLALAQRKLMAMQTAIERVLGAPSGSLLLIDMQGLDAWFED